MKVIVRNLIVAFWPDGGQGRARRNAWSAMVANNKRARERATAEAVVAGVVAASEAALLNPVAAAR